MNENKPTYTTTSPDNVELYRGGSATAAYKAARDGAKVHFTGTETVVRRDGERVGGYRSELKGITKLS